MNKRNLKYLRNVIAERRYGFLMRQGYVDYYLKRGCGSAGCIFGHAAAIWPEVREANCSLSWDSKRLRKKLGITTRQYYEIAVPDELAYFTRANAIAMLDHFIETGEVKWPKVRRKTPVPVDPPRLVML